MLVLVTGGETPPLRELAVISADFVGFGVPDEPFCLHNAKRRFLFYLLVFVFLLIHHKWSPFSAREGKELVHV